jgi:uncharacterized protein YndB with AHSA1/START domain
MKKRKWLITVLLVAAGLAAVLRLPLPFQDRTRIDTVVSIEQPDTIVFDYVTTPANWPRWHPSSLAVSGATDHPLGVGEQVTEEYRVAGRHGHVQWTVTARNRPRQWAIEGAIDGRKAGTVTYTLTKRRTGPGSSGSSSTMHRPCFSPY